jgi:hypothetical protein
MLLLPLGNLGKEKYTQVFGRPRNGINKSATQASF